MEKETDFARHLTSFFDSYLPMERGVSPHTLRSYAHTFTLFIDFMKEVKNTRAEKLAVIPNFQFISNRYQLSSYKRT